MSNFRFWVPIDDITKATDKDGKVVMKLGGIASTNSKDTDGENLDPAGFDISYLKDRGIVNWNHNKSPEAIIGEPTKAEITKKGLYIESELYPDNELANKVYELATTLKKNSKTRRLGYSIEGKATLRDPLNPSSVKKAMITNVALTISPKNPDSIVDIIKGEFHELSDEEIRLPIPNDAAPLTADASAKDFDMSANGGNNFIIDIVRKDGVRVLVDENYNIKIDKALSADSPSGQAITRESLLGAPIITTGPDNQVKNKVESKFLTKAEVIEEILESNSVISIEKANEIYLTLNNLAMSKTQITSELLNKALTQIGLNKSNNISKDMDDDDEIEESEEPTEEDEMSEEIKKPKSKIKKSEDLDEEEEEGVDDEDDADEGREEDLNKFAHHTAMAAHHDTEAEDEDNEDDKIEHHEKRAKFHKSEAKKTKKKLGALSDEDEAHIMKHHKKAGLDEDGEIASPAKLKRYADKNADNEDGYEEHDGETEEEADDDGIGKGFDDDLEKGGGPGSKGGKVIGYTKSGKPIYEDKKGKSYKNFTKQDHLDAAEHHEKERGIANESIYEKNGSPKPKMSTDEGFELAMKGAGHRSRAEEHRIMAGVTKKPEKKTDRQMEKEYNSLTPEQKKRHDYHMEFKNDVSSGATQEDVTEMHNNALKYAKKNTIVKKSFDDDFNEEDFTPNPEFFKSLGVVLKSIYEQQEETNQLIKRQNTLIKGQTDLLNDQKEQIEELKEEIEKSNDAIEDLSNTQGKPKSVTRAAIRTVERDFEKGNIDEFNKSNNHQTQDAKTFSASKQKPRVLSILDEVTFEKGFDPEFGQALTLYESSGVINQKVANRLKEEKGYTIIA